MTSVVLPIRSIAVTLNSCSPGVEVSMRDPDAAGPLHAAITPEPGGGSAQVYAAATCCPRENDAPSSGTARSTVGSTVSTGCQDPTNPSATRCGEEPSRAATTPPGSRLLGLMSVYAIFVPSGDHTGVSCEPSVLVMGRRLP